MTENSKLQMPNSKQAMNDIPNKIYELDERTYQFAKSVGLFCKTLPSTIPILEYKKQVTRSSGSVGANYIEANESLSKKDFLLRIKICRKEAKETMYWLRLIREVGGISEETIIPLIQEADELKRIFSSILDKSN